MTSPATSNFFELAITGAGAKDRFVVFIPGDEETRLAEHTFDWRVDSVEINLNLGELARQAVASEPPEDELHLRMGQRLYQAVFGGAVGELWAQRRKAARRQPLALRLRIDPETARPLLRLPWEYLHDGKRFLALDWHTPIVRLPWGVGLQSCEPLTEALRLLVVIAAPHNLSENEILHSALEEDILLATTAAARRSGRLQVEFAASGSLETLSTALAEFDPHILHFTGHGVFDEFEDKGYLLAEDARGGKRLVSNQDFAALLEQRARSLRLVFLSACQSAVAPRAEGFPDLGTRLLAGGFPAVLAMQRSVFNRSAIEFASAFYQALVGGRPLEQAAAEGRASLHAASPNKVDFATPVLFLADPAALFVDEKSRQAAATEIPLDLSGVTRAGHFAGRAVELRTLQTGLDPAHGPWRAAVIYGLGGMGKTVLAARLAERMASHLQGVVALRMTPTSSAQKVIDQIGGFLLVNNGYFNLPEIVKFNEVKNSPLPLENKLGLLAQIFSSLCLLLIFDNCEDILPAGQAVSYQAQQAGMKPAAPAIDPDLPRLLDLLVGQVPGPSRFLFTSRVDFSPLEANRLSDAVGHLDLGEMRFREVVYLMENLPPLDELPISETVLLRPAEETTTLALAATRPLTKRQLYERLGGHPYTLNLFAEHARRRGAQSVLDDLAGVEKELLEFTLLGRVVEALPERAARLLRCAAIYDEAVPLEGLAYLLGDEQDAMPEVSDETAALRSWGLLACPPGGQDYAAHALVRSWARAQMDGEERLGLLCRAASYWWAMGVDSGDLAHYLSARHYWFLAGDYERADDIVNAVTELLLRWGQIGLLLELLGESVATLQGRSKAVALGSLAVVYQSLGAMAEARRIYEQVLAEFESLGDRRNIAAMLHQLGILHQQQGEYPAARQRYEQSLAIKQELGDRARIASSLHQLGRLHELQGEYPAARQRYEQSLAIQQELGDRVGIASSLHQLGILHQLRGEYPAARQRYEQSLAIRQELGDRAGIASSLHQLGRLHQLQGEYPAARQRYEQSLAIKQELSDRAGIARSLHQLGILHQLQGEYPAARQRYEQAGVIFQELGARQEQAAVLHQLGMLHQDQGEYPAARQRYEQSLAIAQELGDRAGIASSLGQLGRLYEDEGQFAAAVSLVAQALVLLADLGSPDRQIAQRTLERLRQKLGQAAFEQALRDAQVDYENLQAQMQAEPPPEGDQGMTLEQLVQAIVQNTVATLTHAAAQKGQWLQDLGQLHAQLTSPEAPPEVAELAAFAGAVRGLLQGGDLDPLVAQVPAAFHPAWQAILDGVQPGAAVPSASSAAPASPPQPGPAAGDRDEDELTPQEFLDGVVRATVAAMTDQPEKKAGWWGALNQLHAQARRRGDADSAAFFDALRQLLEGASPARLSAQVPEAYRSYWQAVLQEIGRGGRGRSP